jgi:hypothetical protein
VSLIISDQQGLQGKTYGLRLRRSGGGGSRGSTTSSCIGQKQSAHQYTCNSEHNLARRREGKPMQRRKTETNNDVKNESPRSHTGRGATGSDSNTTAGDGGELLLAVGDHLLEGLALRKKSRCKSQHNKASNFYSIVLSIDRHHIPRAQR